MANQTLQNALRNAGLTLEQFAEIIKVDPKSVQRWVTGNTVPYPKHRAAISRALNIAEHEFWSQGEPGERETAITQAPDNGCDVVGTWAYADQSSAPDPVAFAKETDGPIELSITSLSLELTPELADALAAQAAAGREIRILMSSPTAQCQPLIDHEQVTVRIGDAPNGYWSMRAGDRMLFGLVLDGEGIEPQAILELTAGSRDGLFARLTNNFQLLWESDINEQLNSQDQLREWLAEIGAEDDPDEHADELNDDPTGSVTTPSEEHTTRQAPGEPDRDPVTEPSRRWPRRGG